MKTLFVNLVIGLSLTFSASSQATSSSRLNLVGDYTLDVNGIVDHHDEHGHCVLVTLKNKNSNNPSFTFMDESKVMAKELKQATRVKVIMGKKTNEYLAHFYNQKGAFIHQSKFNLRGIALR